MRSRLWRWTAPHPGWRPGAEPESPADWLPDVGAVAYAAPGALVLVDPLVPDESWGALDTLVERHGPRVLVVTTIRWHRRSRDAVAARYGASTSRARASLPQGVETVPIRGAGETMVWIPEHRALVPGDRLVGGAGELRLCPESWLSYLPGKPSLRDLVEALRPLLELPVEMVLTSHGEPVLAGGREAIERALVHAQNSSATAR